MQQSPEKGCRRSSKQLQKRLAEDTRLHKHLHCLYTVQVSPEDCAGWISLKEAGDKEQLYMSKKRVLHNQYAPACNCVQVWLLEGCLPRLYELLTGLWGQHMRLDLVVADIMARSNGVQLLSYCAIVPI